MRFFANLSQVEIALEEFLPARLNRPAYTPEHVARFLALIGDPQNDVPAIHIAGTSGKTSTAYYAAALLQRAGKKVGLLTSPHIEQINERVQIDMAPLDEELFCRDFAVFFDLVDASGITLSHAELLYAFAYWEFARQQVDYMVVEVGLGGTLDATNVITRPDKICVITDIGLDHTATLGSTLAEITAHKAGIIYPGVAVFCHHQSPEIMNVVRKVSNQKRAKLYVLPPAEPPTVLRTLPLFQRRNFVLAQAAVSFALEREGQTLSDEQVAVAMGTHIPGRLETVTYRGRTMVIDGAHNAQKMHKLCEAWQQLYPGRSTAVLLAFTDNRSRDITPMLAELLPIASTVIVTGLPVGSAHTSRSVLEVAAACRRAGLGKVMEVTDPKDALVELCKSKEQHLLVTGSFYLLRHIRPGLQTVKDTQKL